MKIEYIFGIIALIATVGILILVAVIGGGPITPPPPPVDTSLHVGTTKEIIWDKSLIASPSVQVVVLTNDHGSPTRWTAVRVPAVVTENDGSFMWEITSEDVGEEIFVEIGCKNSPGECRAIYPLGPYTVVNECGWEL